MGEAKPHKTRALHRNPRTTTRVRRFTIRDKRGNVLAHDATTISYTRGTCPAATITNPHNIGTQAETCDRCYIVA